MKRITISCLAIIIATFNAACDNRAGFSPPDESAAGVYTGGLNAQVDGVPQVFPLLGMISENNELQMFSPGGGVYFSGRVSVNQTKFDATLVAYVGEAGRFFGFDGLDTLVLDGNITAETGANGSFFVPGLDGTFSLTYELVSNEISSLDFTAGTWSYTDGAYTVTFAVDAAGALTGSDTNACTFTGQVAVINASQNVYQVTMTVANCGMNNGDYSGLAFLASVGGLELDQMVLGVSNDISAYSAILDKT